MLGLCSRRRLLKLSYVAMHVPTMPMHAAACMSDRKAASAATSTAPDESVSW